MPPAPLPTMTPAPGSFSVRPASLHASRAAMTAISDAREYRRGSGRAPRPPFSAAAASTCGASSIATVDGTGAATVQGKADASKSVSAWVALQPRLTDAQNRSRPTPKKLLAIGQKWSPWASVACWFLWKSLDPDGAF